MADFQLTEKEYVQACLQIGQKRLIRFGIIFLISFGLITTSLSRRDGDWKIRAIIGPIVMVGMLTASYFFTVRRLKKTYRQQDSLRYELTVVLNDEEIAYSWPKGQMATEWTSFRRWKETPQFFLLYQSDAFANILPKHALSQEEITLIRRKVEGIKRA